MTHQALPSVPDQTITESSLTDWTARTLEAAGLRPEDARTVTDSLLFADGRGVTTHGVARLPLYVRRIAEGGIRVDGRPVEVVNRGAVGVIDGCDAPGAVTAVLATRTAVSRAREHGVGLSLARAVNDIGAVGYYASLAARENCIGFVACNTDAVMCAPGGAVPVLGTNPLAIAVPGSYALLDMATSATAYGKIVRARDEGRRIPDDWAVDELGQPTTDPRSALQGALMPAGGPKGFGLAFMIDVMAALAGATTSPFIPPFDSATETPQDLGVIVVAIYSVGLTDPEDFQERVASLIDAVHASGDGDGARAFVPGELEFSLAQALEGRVPLRRDLVDSLCELGETLGVRFPLDELESPQEGGTLTGGLAAS